jgi:hypothetical protein
MESHYRNSSLSRISHHALMDWQNNRWFGEYMRDWSNTTIAWHTNEHIIVTWEHEDRELISTLSIMVKMKNLQHKNCLKYRDESTSQRNFYMIDHVRWIWWSSLKYFKYKHKIQKLKFTKYKIDCRHEICSSFFV